MQSALTSPVKKLTTKQQLDQANEQVAKLIKQIETEKCIEKKVYPQVLRILSQ